MKIWIIRHGQTELNRNGLMQGITNARLNKTGILQAKVTRKKIGSPHFDAVYSSPLHRAVATASIVGDVPESEVIIDERLIETDFGIYEKRKYYLLGPHMTLYWWKPTIFPKPKSVESTDSMVARSSSFLSELEKKNYKNVLISCHGGIMRALCGYLENEPTGLRWRRPENCEVRVYEYKNGKHRFVRSF